MNPHRELGMHDAAQGKTRYKFQDPHLQELYNEGYDFILEDKRRQADAQSLGLVRKPKNW